MGARTSTAAPHAATTGAMPIVRLRHPAKWVTALVLLVLAAMLVHALITNSAFGWPVVRHFLFSRQILVGLERTVVLTAIAMAIGIVLGTILAVMKTSQNGVLASLASSYIWFFRGTPLLVQLIFWYNLSALYPRLSAGIPFGPSFLSVQTNSVINVFGAAILGLGLNEAAYMAEIIRSGLLSVDRGQADAARAIGMQNGMLFRRIILPQALRIIVPPTGNQVIGMLKATSLVSVIALPELLYSAQLIYSANFQTIPLLVVACIWYLIVTSVLSVGQIFVERYYGKGNDRREGGVVNGLRPRTWRHRLQNIPRIWDRA